LGEHQLDNSVAVPQRSPPRAGLLFSAGCRNGQRGTAHVPESRSLVRLGLREVRKNEPGAAVVGWALGQVEVLANVPRHDAPIAQEIVGDLPSVVFLVANEEDVFVVASALDNVAEGGF
jgi:hypothetical protein